MRLRQVALVARDLEPPMAILERAFGLQVAFRDPAVGVFGLVNVVMPVGGEFLEIVQPVRADASAARYLARRGGDAGYMVILQDEDALAHRARIQSLGARVIAKRDEGRYRFSHFHPADCAGILLSIDSVHGEGDWREPMSDWPPAGDWRRRQSPTALGLSAVILQARAPQSAAERWSALLDIAPRRAGDSWELPLERGRIGFVRPVDEDATGVVGLEMEVDDPLAALGRAREAGAVVQGDAVIVCGAAVRPVSRGGQ